MPFWAVALTTARSDPSGEAEPGNACDSRVRTRVTGDAPRDYLIAPEWVHRKAEFLQLLDCEMIRRGTVQGRRCSQV